MRVGGRGARNLRVLHVATTPRTATCPARGRWQLSSAMALAGLNALRPRRRGQAGPGPRRS